MRSRISSTPTNSTGDMEEERTKSFHQHLPVALSAVGQMTG